MKYFVYSCFVSIVFPGMLAAQIHSTTMHDHLRQKTLERRGERASKTEPTQADSLIALGAKTFYAKSQNSSKTRGLAKSSDDLFKTDSIKTDNTHLKLQYDAAGNNTVTERWFYNTFTGNLQTLLRYVREFEGGNEISENRISVHPETFAETPLSRLEYTYSAEGFLLTEKRLTWADGAENPDPQYLISFSANDNGLLESMTRCNYIDGDEDQCLNSSKTDYTYNDAQLETERITSDWDGDTEEWVWSSRWLNTYEENLLLLEEQSAWTGESWQVTRQIIYAYDDAGNEVSIEQQFYSAANEVWNPDWRYLVEYNAEGLPAETLFQTWLQPSQEWRNFSKELFVYDAAGNTSEGTFYFWNNNQNEWLEEGAYSMEYDLDVPAANVLPTIQSTFDEGFIFESKILQFTILYNPESKGPGDEFRTYYYSPITILNASAHKGPELTLYPNPVKDELFVDFGGVSSPAVLTMHDLQGRVVLQKQLNNNISLSVGKLSKGIYVYTLQGAEINQSGKVVKVE